jgi:hypothetical protein
VIQAAEGGWNRGWCWQDRYDRPAVCLSAYVPDKTPAIRHIVNNIYGNDLAFDSFNTIFAISTVFLFYNTLKTRQYEY